MAGQALSRALEAIFELVGAANRYVDAQAPWALRKSDPARMATVLYALAETIRRLALLTQAFLPDASARILDQLAVAADARTLAHCGDSSACCGRARRSRRRPAYSRASRASGAMLVDSHCHLDFPALAEEGDAVVERAARPGSGRSRPLVRISTASIGFWRSPQLIRASTARSGSTRIGRRRSRSTAPSRCWRTSVTRRSSASARAASTTTTTTAPGACRRPPSGPTSPPPARAGCR